jgi:choline-sulfatase
MLTVGERRPDLILVMTDQQRFDQVGYASAGPVRTPNLDRLAADGVVFEQAYSASTTCVPARTSLLTGLLDHRTPYVAPWALEPTFFTVPHALRAAGYQTALIGKMHFDPIRTPHGFEHMRVCEHLRAYRRPPEEQPELDHYHQWLHEQGLPDWRFERPDLDRVPYALPPETHPTSWVEQETLAFLRERDPDRPLFLVVSFPHPHPPVNPPEPYASLYDPDDCPVDPDAWEANAGLPARFVVATTQIDHPGRRVDRRQIAAHQADLARTYGLITQVDDAVGRITDELDLDHALLFFTSDHGDFAGHRGLIRKVPWIPFDDLARVPCFATGGLVKATRAEPNPMQSFDFAVTCLDYAGIDVDLSDFDGTSLRPVLSDPAASVPVDRLVYCALTMGWPMVRRGPIKYIRELGFGQEVLFNLEFDPGETVDFGPKDHARRLLGEFEAAVTDQLGRDVPSLPSFPGSSAEDVESPGSAPSQR